MIRNEIEKIAEKNITKFSLKKELIKNKNANLEVTAYIYSNSNQISQHCKPHYVYVSHLIL